MINKIIGNYKIIGIVGEGGMGTVYKAFDFKLERFAAIKVITGINLKDKRFLERFRREAKHQASLSHINIVPVYDFVEEEGMMGIIMEFVDGITLDKLIEQKKQLSLEESVSIMKSVLEGVNYAHSKGFIHRDLKPSNIIISNEGTVKIMDFGISKSYYDGSSLTKTGAKMGTLLYMSPEQIKALEPTNQSDLYSLGLIFYEMLNGTNPFDAATDFEVMESHLKKIPKKITSIRPDLPKKVDSIISNAISKTTEKRYKDCSEFIEDLNSLNEIMDGQIEKKKKRTTSKDIIAKVPEKAISNIKMFTILGFVAVVFALIAYFVINLTQVNKKTDIKKVENVAVKPVVNILNKDNWQEDLINKDLNFISLEKSGDALFLFSGNGQIYSKSIDGNTWQLFLSLDSISINHVLALDNIFYITNNTDLIKIDVKTKKAVRINIPVNFIIMDVTYRNKELYLSGNKGKIIKTNNDGKKWKEIQSSIIDNLSYLIFQDNKNSLALTQSGIVLHSNNIDLKWTVDPDASNNNFRTIIKENNKIFAINNSNDIFAQPLGKHSFEKVNATLFNSIIISLSSKNNNELYAVTRKGEIFKSDNGGVNWSVSYSNPDYVFNKVVNIEDKVYVLSSNGKILYK